jgi:tol-pal system protein YbgF
MIRTMLERTVVLLTLVMLCIHARPAPLAAADREHQQIMADLRMLQEQTQQLQALLNGLGDALKAVNARLDDQTSLERKAFADGKVQMDGISGDIRVVREKVDETNVRLSSLSQEIESLRTTVSQPAPAAAPTTDGAPPEGTPAPVAAAPAAAPPFNPGISPSRLWTTAFADYSAGQYSLAVQGFESYLKYFPKGVQAAEAQLYIGQSHELDGKLLEAVAAYDQVIANFPGSEHVAQAYYKRGFTLEKLKDIDRAKESYETVAKQFPDSSAANLARQRLEALNKPAR